MDCTLMHKNISVVDIVIDDETKTIRKVQDTHNACHLLPSVNVCEKPSAQLDT